MVSEPLEQRILRKVRERTRASPRAVARLLIRHAHYQDTLRAIDRLVATGVLRRVPMGKYATAVTIADQPGIE